MVACVHVERRAVSRIALALALTLFAVASGSARNSARADGAAPQASARLVVHGLVLVVDAGYLVFTTTDALRLGAGVAVPQSLALGSPVRVVLDARTHAITSIEPDPGLPNRGEIDASALPREFVAVDPRSAQSPPTGPIAGARSAEVSLTIAVRVPADTPPTDDVYLATDRTNFSATELRMNRVDAHAWTISLRLPAGSTLRYLFTRGSFATVERERGGGIETPRALTAAPNAITDDVVARWADST
jgi:hypothetical protein